VASSACAFFCPPSSVSLSPDSDLKVIHRNEEDYRWVVLRKKIPSWLFQVTNLVFIGTSHGLTDHKYGALIDAITLTTAAIQNILLLLIATPALIAATHPSPLILSDIILTLTALMLLTFEFIADNQQFAFHAWKHGTYNARAHWPGARLAWTKDDTARGFCTRGLWSWSRHPNFFAEQSFWVGVVVVSPSPPCRHGHLLTHTHTKTSGRTQSHPYPSRAERTSADPPSQEHVDRRTAYRPATGSLARALPAFLLFDAFHRVHLGQQVPARLRRISFTRRDVRALLDACLGRASQFDGRET